MSSDFPRLKTSALLKELERQGFRIEPVKDGWKAYPRGGQRTPEGMPFVPIHKSQPDQNRAWANQIAQLRRLGLVPPAEFRKRQSEERRTSLRQEVEMVQQTSSTETSEVVYRCPECGRTARTAAALGSHRRAHGVKGGSLRAAQERAKREANGSVKERGLRNAHVPTLEVALSQLAGSVEVIVENVRRCEGLEQENEELKRRLAIVNDLVGKVVDQI